MVLLTRARAPRFLGTMWYYFSLLLIFTFVTFIHYFSYVCILFLADFLEYKQLDIVEFLLEHCKELVKQVLAVCSTHNFQKLYLCGLGVLVVHQGAQLLGLGAAFYIQLLP